MLMLMLMLLLMMMMMMCRNDKSRRIVFARHVLVHDARHDDPHIADLARHSIVSALARHLALALPVVVALQGNGVLGDGVRNGRRSCRSCSLRLLVAPCPRRREPGSSSRPSPSSGRGRPRR